MGIIVGLCTVELFIPESQSLKDKRQVLLSLKDRLREQVQSLRRRGRWTGFVAEGCIGACLRGQRRTIRQPGV